MSVSQSHTYLLNSKFHLMLDKNAEVHAMAASFQHVYVICSIYRQALQIIGAILSPSFLSSFSRLEKQQKSHS
eukprot:c16854_g1_i2 orf=612-830(+)